MSEATVDQYRKWLEQTANQYAATQAEIERLNQSLARVGVISPPLTELVNYIMGGK
jgi:hypothetical protein